MSGLYATMSARRPGSEMLRAATAASGGMGAPFAMYCSICDWMVRMSAWTSTPDAVDLGDLLDLGEEVRVDALRSGGAGCAPWPWTIARTVPSWSCTTWAIFARVPIS